MRLNGPRPAVLCAATLVPLLLAGLGACTTQVKVQPSAAILETRRAVAERAKAGGGVCVDPRDLGAEATVVPFGFLLADLDESAMRRIQTVAAWGRCAPANRIVLTGEADNHGTPAEQADLVARRMAAIRQALTAAGVADERISVAAQAKDVPADGGAPLVLLGRGRGW